MTLLLPALLSGLTFGGALSLISLGMVFIFRATRIFNFAHGEFMLLPAFLVCYFESQKISSWLSVVVALCFSAFLGGFAYRAALRRTVGMPFFIGVTATFGVAYMLDGLMAIFFRAPQYSLSLPFLSSGRTHIIGTADIATSSLELGAVSVVLAIAVVGFTRFTTVGVRVRAAGQNPLLAAQGGIHVERLFAVSWVVASVLAGIGGITYGAEAIVNTSITSLGLVAIPAITLGGMDSIEGAFVGGMAIGLLQSFVNVYLGVQYQDVVTYAATLGILLVYPQGILGTKEIVRA